MFRRRYPVYMMTSYARSGETLTLRCLNAHPDITVLHQVRRNPSDEDKKLALHIRATVPQRVTLPARFVRERRLHDRSVLLVKRGTWQDVRPYRGFALARNPFSVIASQAAFEDEVSWRHRLSRWTSSIDPSLLPLRESISCVELSARLYTAQMLAAARAGVPIVRFEDLLEDPRRELERIISYLGLQWSEAVLESHSAYGPGEVGHGRIDLSRPIAQASGPIPISLQPDDIRLIQRITSAALETFGYTLRDAHVICGPLPLRPVRSIPAT
jgi:hypothetical protein